MKNKVICLLLILCVLFIGCSKKEEKKEDFVFKDESIEELKKVHDDLVKVVAHHYGEGGRVCYDMTPYMEEVYKRVVNMKVLEETEEITVDNESVFIFFTKDKQLSFNFNGGNYEKNNKYYKIEKTNYKYEYDHEIECE